MRVRRWLRWSLCPGAIAAVLIALAQIGVPSAGQAADPPAVAVGVYLPQAAHDPAALHNYADQSGRRPDLVEFYTDWTHPFPAAAVDRIVAAGALPIVTWEPWQAGRGVDQPAYALDAIAAGAFDDYLREWAAAARATDQPILLRFAHEMNGDWYPWSGVRNGQGGDAYIRAYRHIHGIFQAAGAERVRWVWSPNHESFPATPWNAAAAYYPGDEYVDVIGVDGYNWGTTRPDTRWRDFDSLFGPILTDFDRRYPGKPQIVAELASTEYGGDKAAWIADAYAAIGRYPRLRAVVWFSENKETDWRIDSSPAALAAYRRAIQAPPFAASDPLPPPP